MSGWSPNPDLNPIEFLWDGLVHKKGSKSSCKFELFANNILQNAHIHSYLYSSILSHHIQL